MNSVATLTELTLAQRRELLNMARARAMVGDPSELPPIRPGARGGRLPLSFAQERLWLIDRLEPGSAVYNIPVAWRLVGALDAVALERALGEIVRRHEALRTVFAEVDGSPAQVIAPFSGFALVVEELSGLGAADVEAAVRRRAGEEAGRAFDLAAGPLFRAALLRLGAADHVLLLSVHHIAGDGWSMGVLYRELSSLYEAYREGGESPLAELPVQYADYALWQREHLRDDVLEGKLAYWRKRLADAPAVLELPTDHPRPAVRTFRGAHERIELPHELLERLEALARSEGATLYMTLLGAFQLLLSKYSGSDDIVVGSPIAGRTRKEVEELIGFFVNTLVLRTDLSGDPTFREVMRRAREVTLGAYEHQDVPFERLVAELQPERSLSHTPLFQVMFALQNAVDRGIDLPGVEVGEAAAELASAKFDLFLMIKPTARGLRVGLNYSTDLFERGTIVRMLGYLARLLEQVAANPDARLSRLELIGDAERARLLALGEGAAPELPSATVDALFARAAAAAPEAAALVWDGGRMTYAELDRRANRLAHHLRRAGVGAGTRVGVCLERGPEMVVATLAALKAGGAYVPLDAAYPAERLAFMLADTAVPVLVTESGLADRLPPHAARVVRVDTDAAAIAAEPADAPAAATDPEAAAYVMYTSGSTGRPKGVEVPHRAIARLVRGQSYVSIDPSDTFLQLAPASFDAATLELWGPLLNGARLAIHPAGQPSVESIGRALAEHGVTILWLTAGLFHLVVEERIEILRGVRQLLAGGDVLSVPHARRVLEELPATALINGYGPTENTTFTCCHRVGAEPGGSIPVGRPIANTYVRVLDAALQPVPVGMPGELYAGGAGLALGYLNQPELTAEKFVADPFAAGARLYRTGDRVRWRADGAVEFLGRVDTQVKIRGFRVEPGEVEAVLRAWPGVREAAVVVREDTAGDRRLVGYVAGDAAADVLREHLRGRLPEYMVPGAFVFLDVLPLTANGKVDRKALPAPELAGAEERYVAPRTPVEEVLAGIWAEVLRLERVGVGESFFELGGHSLLATRVVSRVRELFGVELPLRALFEGPTVAELASAVEDERRRGLPALPPVEPVGRGGALPLSFAQERLWLVDQMDGAGALYNIPVARRLAGALDVAALRGALAEIVRRHEALRTVFREVDGSLEQVIVPFAGFSVPLEDLSGLDAPEREAEAGRRAAADATLPFDLAAGPLIRARLLRLDEDEHVLLLCVHHIASDGWSMGVLLHELAVLYGAFREERGSPLPELAVQYADYAVWQRRHLEGDALEAHLAYWRAALAGAPELLALPADHPRPAARTHRGAHESIELPAELLERLRALGRGEGATLFMVLLGAFQALLSRYGGGGDDVVVGSPIAGHTSRELEGLIGYFANTLVLRTELGGDPAFRDVLRRVRAATLGAHEHQDVPFDRLVAELRPERSTSHTPLFQVTFTLQDGELSGWSLPELRVSPVETEARFAKFDLLLAMDATSRGLRAKLTYATDLFERGTIRRMLGHLERVLRQVADDADVRLSGLKLAGEVERATLAAGAATQAFPVAERLDRRFEARALERPDAPALTFEAETLTYHELNRRANRLAHRLRAMGVGPETRVGIALERSAGLVAAILGVLKAGAAYVPLDPSYPADRIAFVLEDAGIAVLVTTRDLLAQLPAFAGAALRVDTDAEAIARESGENPGVEAGPDTLAYVIYTSGSTGKPKGVQVTHANVARLFDATEAWFGFAADDVWTLFHSCAFDFSVWEIWGALLYGGRLVVVPFLTTRSPEDFHRLLVDEGVTMLSQTPSAFKQLAQADLALGVQPSALRLRRVVFGGEALDPRSLRPWMERHGDAETRLVNMYGITETTVHVTYREITRADLERGGSPIGVPIPDLSLYVLDAGLEPVPAGVAGELFVGGAGVARGYLNRPELTAERFIRDPFSADPAARLYRTGDLARRRADGELEYLGRADQQVKIRGFRIELGEIEAALASHAAVAACAVVAREDAAGERRLVAYVVAPPGGAVPGVAELRAHLAQTLPDYMVPAAFVPLNALPLTENGKLDRRALPAPEAAGAAISANAYVAPETAAETELAHVWREVLGVERVGIDDNYFALGGDSIRSVRLVAAARRRGLSLSIPHIYRHQTVRALAAAAERVDPLPHAPDAGGAPFALLDPGARSGLPEDVEDAYPVSRVQLGMLYHTARDPDSLVYHEVLGFRVHTRFDEAAMREALRRVARRHPLLRTSFDLAARPEPIQRVHSGAEIPLEITDARAVDPDARDAWMEPEKVRGFDWSVAPLVRVHAHILADDEFRLVFVEHHAVLDGWSVASLMTELLRTYAALRDGEPDPAGAPPAASFRDFVALEREAVASGESRAFWRGVMEGAPEATLPPREGDDAPRPDDAPYLWVDFPAGVAEGLSSAAAGAGVPLKTVLLAVHLRVLALLAAADEVVTGYVTNGRPETEGGERVLGVFLNTVPLRVRTAGGTWGELVRRTWAAEAELLPHRRFPLSEIVRDAGGRTPFEAAFNFNHFHVYEALSAGGVRMRGDQAFQKTEVPLLASFVIHSATGALRLRLEYDPSRMGDAQARALSGWYLRGLEAAAAADPDTPLSGLPLLAPEEREAMLAAGAATRAFPVAQRLDQRFEARALERPHAPALTFEAETLTYHELNRRANRLAHRLRAMGVGPETRVGIALERSAGLVAAILGVLKAGAAYVPLDPSYPADRIAFVLEDAGIAVLVTTSDLLARLPAFAGAALRVDTDAEAIARESGENPGVEAGPHTLAYVIYTSGSTGKPKGVRVTHANVARLFDATEAWFGFAANDVWTLFHSCAFDFSVWEIWGALLYGGRLVVVPFLTTRSPEDFHRLLVDEGVTMLSQTPSAFKQLAQADLALGVEPSALRLRRVVFGGEALDPRSLRPWMERHGDAEPRLVNMYGITETTVHVTYREITRADLERGGSPIGVPIPDLSLYVLDAGLEPVPAGVAGELFVGGAGVARGYLNRPELTAERFIRNPFSADPAARLYRTGDLARRRADGELEYLGRADQQVKIRGFRIELGEIEAALASHAAVAACAVVAREDTAGERRLVAYVVLQPGEAEDAMAMRAALSARLPDHMVPAIFVVLPEMPLTSHGKLDRRALPAPEAGRTLRPAYAAPARASERLLQEVWHEVLGAERIGVLENFFAAGGDSIRAVQMVSVLRQRGMTLTVRDLFEEPTIRGLAERSAAAGRGSEASDGSVPHHLADLPEEERARARAVFPAPFQDVYPATGMQTVMLREYAKDVARAGVYHPQQCHRLTDPLLSIGALRHAIGQVVGRHAILRTVFMAASDGTLLQVVRESPCVPIVYHDLRGLSPDERERAVQAGVAEDLDTPFDPFDPRGSLMRFVIFHREDHVADILISAHHAIEDGWGNVHFLNTLFEAYAEARDGRPISAAPVPNTYREFVALEAEIVASDDARTFWRDRMRDVSAPWPTPRIGTGESARECRVLREATPELTAALRETASRQGVAVKALYLSSFLDVLAAFSGGEDACAGVVWNGRSERLSDPLTALGLFWNLVPVTRPTTASGGAEGRALAVHHDLLQADRFGRYPLAEIMADGGGREPFFSTFNFLHFRNWSGREAVHGGNVQPVHMLDRLHLPFNLAVSLSPRGEGAKVRVEYDDRFFSRVDVAAALESYLLRLEELTSTAVAGPLRR